MLDLETSHINWVIVGFVFHTVAYLYIVPAFFSLFSASYRLVAAKKELLAKRKAEWDSRGVSTVHAVITACAAFYCLFIKHEYDDLTMLHNTHFAESTLMFMVGYFIYDLYIVIKYFPNDYGALAHHICAILQHFAIVSGGVCAFAQITFVLTEFSTPFVNNRFFFVDSDMKESMLYKLNGIMMFLTFGLIRIPMIPFVPYLLYTKYDEWVQVAFPFQCVFLFMYCVITTLNSYWFYKITQGIIKTLVPPKMKAN
jgi:hypothetical protein